MSKKTLYIATVGEHNKPVEIGLTKYPIDKVVLLPSEETLPYAEELKRKIYNDYGIPVEIVTVKPFDLIDSLRKTLEIIKNHKNYEPIVNMSCGARTMSLGAQLAVDIEQGKAIYILQREKQTTNRTNRNTNKKTKPNKKTRKIRTKSTERTRKRRSRINNTTSRKTKQKQKENSKKIHSKQMRKKTRKTRHGRKRTKRKIRQKESKTNRTSKTIPR